MKKVTIQFDLQTSTEFNKSHKTTTESQIGVSNKCPTMLTTLQVNKAMDNYYRVNTK